MSKQELITVYDVIGAATEDGEWVNGEFRAVVRNAKPKQGNKPSKADLCDPDSPNIKLSAAWFGGDLSDFEGATVLFGGKGMKVKDYKGKAELNIGKDALVNVVTAAPSRERDSNPPGRPGGSPAANDSPKPAASAKSNVDPVTYFHRELSKMALGYLHCLQYAQDIVEKHPLEIPDAQFQACVSTLFIEGSKAGLFHKVPKLREIDDKSLPMRFIPPEKPAADPAEIERQRLEKEKEAAEKARLAHEEEQRRKAAELDEDVPF